MSHVILSYQTQGDLSRLYDFLSHLDYAIADKALETIIQSFDLLEQMPLSGSQVPERKGLRKLVIEFGNSGYTVFYEYFPETDTVVIARIFHQKEKSSGRHIHTI